MTTIPTTHTIDDLDVGPCPAWCTLPAGHPWDSTWPGGTVTRGHQGPTATVTGLAERETADASLSALETHGGGLSELGISIDAGGVFTAPAVRELAARLLAVADRLDEVTR